MSGIADFIEYVNQGLLVVRFESNAKVNRSSNGRGAQALPVLRDRAPCVFHMDDVPIWCDGRRGATEGPNGKDKEHRDSVAAHNDRDSPR